MNRRMTYLTVTATEVFAGLSINPRNLAALADKDIAVYRAAARRALKQLQHSHTARDNRNHYTHSCWVDAASAM